MKFALLLAIIVCCVGISNAQKKDYQLADDFLKKLRHDRADTIVFYKRTCISCCDFYNIFWSDKGARHLTKIYFDFNDRQTHRKTIALTNDKMFDFLAINFIDLKSTSIKQNSHKNPDGTSNVSAIDHYCYAQMSIYTKQNKIETDRMKDHDFDKYTDYGHLPYKQLTRQGNDSYLENINSKWNLFLNTIETELSAMPETISQELETLRMTEAKYSRGQ